MTPETNPVFREATGSFAPSVPTDSSSARVHLSGSTPANAFSIVEFSSVPGKEPPPSVYATEDRFFCLLEGEWDVRVGDERFRVKAGGSFFAPRGVHHEYRILSPIGRAVVLITGGQKFHG